MFYPIHYFDPNHKLNTIQLITIKKRKDTHLNLDRDLKAETYRKRNTDKN